MQTLRYGLDLVAVRQVKPLPGGTLGPNSGVRIVPRAVDAAHQPRVGR